MSKTKAMRWNVALYHALLTALIGAFIALTIFCGRGVTEMPPPSGQPYAAAESAQAEKTIESDVAMEPVHVVSPKTGDSLYLWVIIMVGALMLATRITVREVADDVFC